MKADDGFVLEQKTRRVRLCGADTDDVPGAVKALAGGGTQVSVDALGIETTCQNSVLSLGNRGQHVQIGLTTQDEQGMVSLPTDAMVMQEIEFIGSLGMPPTRYDEIFRLVASGKLDPSAVVSETVGLDDVPEKLDAMTDFERSVSRSSTSSEGTERPSRVDATTSRTAGKLTETASFSTPCNCTGTAATCGCRTTARSRRRPTTPGVAARSFPCSSSTT
nr:zinc-binding dehydrogenase [Haloprofundus halobius]